MKKGVDFNVNFFLLLSIIILLILGSVFYYTYKEAYPIKRFQSEDQYKTRSFSKVTGYVVISQQFSTYLGGSLFEHIRDVAFDAQGNTYVTGGTESPNFPVTVGVYQTVHNPGTPEATGVSKFDVFVTKLDPTGRIIWSTFIGGPNYDRTYAIEVDSQGYIYVAGRAGRGFPVTAGAFQTTFMGGQEASFYGNQDGFVAKLSPDGSRLIWASYFGAADPGIVRDIDIDQNSDIYLAGVHTTGFAYPGSVTSAFQGTFQPNAQGGKDTVIAKVKSDGSQVLWATYLGGSSDENDPPALRIDSSNNVYILAGTSSTNFPVTAGAFDTTYNGGTDLYVAKLSPSGSQLLFATYLGGSGNEGQETHQIALDTQGNIFVGMPTSSSNYPTTLGAFDTTYNGGNNDIAISKLSNDGTKLLASTFIGGSFGWENPQGIGTDLGGNVYFSGSTQSSNFPVTTDAFQKNFGGVGDAVAVKFSPDLSKLLYSTYIGGSAGDALRSTVVDANGNFAMAGQTASTNWPTRNALQANYGGGIADAMLVKFSIYQPPTTDTTPPTISNIATTSITTSGATITWTTNEDSDSQVEYGTTTSYGLQTTLDTTLTTSHSVTLAGLSQNTLYHNTLYHYRVKSKDSSGNLATSSDAVFTTSIPTPTLPPVPVGLTANAISSSQINLAWNAVTGVGVSYKIYRNGVQIATSNTNSYLDTSLTASTTYTYKVAAYDVAGNPSAQSSSVSATTQAQPLSGGQVTPVGIWHLDEGSGSVVNDALGGPQGIVSGTPQWVPGQGGTALQFRGNTGPTVSIPLATSFSLDDTFTIEAWANSAGFNQFDEGVVGLETPAGVQEVRIAFDCASSPYFRRHNTIPATYPLPVGQWTHLVGTYNNGEARLYIDGALSQVTSSTNVQVACASALRGGSTGLTATTLRLGGFGGSIDEVTLYRGAMSASLVRSRFESTVTGRIVTLPNIVSMTKTPIGGLKATVSWTTSPETTGQIDFGLTTNYGYSTPIEQTFATDHQATLNGLNPNQRYYLRLRVKDSNGNTIERTDVLDMPQAPELRISVPPTITVGSSLVATLTVYKQDGTQDTSQNGAVSVISSGAGCSSNPQQIIQLQSGTAKVTLPLFSSMGLCKLEALGPQGLRGLSQYIVVSPAPGTANGLVLYYPFDDGEGPVVRDVSGNANHGTKKDLWLSNEGSDHYLPQLATGLNDGALRFDGTDDTVTAPATPSLNFPTEYSVMLWFKVTSGTHYKDDLINKFSAFRLRVQAGGYTVYFAHQPSGGFNAVALSTGILNGQWHHIAAILRDSTKEIEFYIDGQLVGKNSYNVRGPFSGSQPLRLGSESDNTEFLHGLLDEVKIYNRALLASEIKNIYESGGVVNVRTPTITSFSANPSSIPSGRPSTLSWSSTNTISCSAPWTASMATSGSQTVSPTSTTTYTMTCTGAGGSASRTATVTVSSVAPPTVSLFASPSTIQQGQSSILNWLTTYAASCTASGGWTGTKSTVPSSESISPSSTTTYTITCSGTAGGSAAQSVTVTVSSISPRPSVVASHPRIWLTPALLTELKARAAANDPDWLALKRGADNLLTQAVVPYCRSGCGGGIVYDYLGHGWLDVMEPLILAYQVTGNNAYADKGIEILKVANAETAKGNLDPINTGGGPGKGFPSRAAALAIALGYDWLYNRLDAQTKIDTYNTLNAWFDWYKTGAYQLNGPAYGNFFGGHMVGFGAAGYATYGDNPRSQEIIDFIRNKFDNVVPAAFTTGGFAGGYPVESYNYGPGHFARLLQYMLAIKTATGEDLLSNTDYAKKIATNLLYNLKPNRWQTTDEGYFPGSVTGVMGKGLPLLLSHVLAGTTEGQWMKFYYNNFAPSPSGTEYFQRVSAFEAMLFYNPARPQADYRLAQPTYYRSAGDEHLYTRSSWQDNAVWASFRGGPEQYADHQARGAGHIAIQRGNDYLLVNSGQWQGLSGVTGVPSAGDLASWRTNTLFFNDFGEYFPTGTPYVGGQGYWGSNNILNYEAGNNYVYEKADLTSTYDIGGSRRNDNLRSLRYFHRNFVYLGDGFFALFDRVKALKSTYVKKLYFHFNPTDGLPQINGDTIKSTVGSSAIFIKTLFPLSPTIAINSDPGTDNWASRTVTYRAEVADSVISTDFDALTIIAVTDKNTNAMANMERIISSAGNMVGASIFDPTTPRVIMFSKDGSLQSAVTYTANYPNTLSGRHVLIDIAPGTYDVYKNGAKILSSVAASSQGVLSFDSQGGSTFAIVQTGITPPQDRVPPIISNGLPSGTLPAGTTSITLSLTTNEVAICKYSTTPNTAYASMASTFSTNGGTSHSTTISGLKDGSTYNYYIRCIDIKNNVNTNDFTITFSVASSGAWVPPIGIPVPPFGIVETVESIYGDSNYYTHYVDSSSTACTDSSNPKGTASKPRCTFPSGSSLVPGSVVEIHGGPYVTSGYTSNAPLISSGTAGQPIFIRGKPGARPVIERTIRVRGSYIIIENIDFNKNRRAESAIDVRPDLSDPVDNVHHVAVRNSEMHNYALGPGGASSLVGFAGITSNSNKVHDIVIYNNNIHSDTSDIVPPDAYEYDINGVGVSIMTDRIWIVDNEIHHNGGDSVGSGHAADYTATNYYIGRNIMHDNAENAVDLKEVKDFIVSQNKMYNFFGASAGSDGTVTVAHNGPQKSPRNIWFLYNEIYNGVDKGGQIGGGSLNNPDEIYYIGNIIHDIHNVPSTAKGFMSWSSDHVYLIGNTIYNVDNGLDFTGSGSGASVATIANNIFGTIQNPSGYHLTLSPTDYRNAAIINNNLFYQAGGSVRINWGSTIYNVANFKSASGKCLGCIEANPLFVNPVSSDFHLQSSSPATNSGNLEIMEQVYSTFESRFPGQSIRVDFDKKVRPQGAAYDIGAYEFSSLDTTPPTRLNGLPTGTVPSSTISVTIRATTNENANCRYSINSNIPYNSMTNAFSVTGTTTHSKDIIGLTSGTYSYYTKCIDASGNFNTNDYLISFSIAPPSIQPRLIITSPVDGAIVASRNIRVTYTKSGELTNVDHAHLQLDENPEVRDLDFDGNYLFNSVPLGTHTLKGYLARADHTKILGTDVTISFTTIDVATPTDDTDDDDVPDTIDKCPLTKLIYKLRVNKYGCPNPIVGKFSSELTTNFSDVDLRNFTNLKIGIKNRGQIDYGDTSITLVDNTTGSFDPIDLDSIFDFLQRKVIVRSNQFRNLNVSTIITIMNLTDIVNPVIRRDKVTCTECIILSFTNKNLIFRVPHFTEYLIEEGSYCGDTYCSSQESCSSCSSDCGSCPAPPSSGGGAGGGGTGGGGSFSLVCNRAWECDEWSDCINGLQTRQCEYVKVPQRYQETPCAEESKPPERSRACEVETETQITTQEKLREEQQPEKLLEVQPPKIEQPTGAEEKVTKFKLYWLYIAAIILPLIGFLTHIEIKRINWHRELRRQHEQQKIMALRNYVSTNLDRGYSPVQIRNALIENNYSNEEVEEAFRHQVS